jgi:thiol-disulfide isomerase/thioredoxin
MRVATIALAVLTLLTACDTTGGSVPRSSTPAANATSTALLPTEVSALPSMDFDAYEQLLYQLRGTPVVVNLWASWCGPCAKESAALVEAARRYGHEVQFVGVDVRDERADAGDFLARYHVPYPSVFDPSGDVHDRLGFVGLPDTIFYAADGTIADTWSGPIDGETLGRTINRLVTA